MNTLKTHVSKPAAAFTRIVVAMALLLGLALVSLPAEMAWQDWLSAVGLPQPDHLRTAHYTTFITLIHAVMAAQGLGLGWRRLIDPLLKSGDVVQLGPYAAQPKGAYYLIEAPDRSSPRPRAVSLLKDWILTQSRQAG